MPLLFTISATCHWNLEKLELYHSVMFSVKSLRKPQLHVGLSCQFILLHLPLSLSLSLSTAAAAAAAVGNGVLPNAGSHGLATGMVARSRLPWVS